MKKHCLCLLLVFCLLLCACGEISQPVLPEEEEHQVELSGTVEPGDTDLTRGQEKILRSFMDTWYRGLGKLSAEDFSPLFLEMEEAREHWGMCQSLCLIRTAALEDLHLTNCRWSLSAQEIRETEEGTEVTLLETTTMHFAGLTVYSELFDLEHIFTLSATGEDTWLIAAHEADDTPYYWFSLDELTGMDKNQTRYDRMIQRRQLQQQETVQVSFSCDHPYDRQAAYDYMMEYADHRNPAWQAFDEVGGNCMNFGSQVLLSGGIPMDKEDGWYWLGKNQTDLPFINVGKFLDYARENEDFGLVADVEAGYYTGEVGDLLILGMGTPRHTTVICGLVQNGEGNTVDYLLCSNTNNYRNFPASAYYYTGQQLVKIIGWNEAKEK